MIINTYVKNKASMQIVEITYISKKLQYWHVEYIISNKLYKSLNNYASPNESFQTIPLNVDISILTKDNIISIEWPTFVNEPLQSV